MQFTEIVARLSGISTPFGGVNWNPPEPDVTAARRVLEYLEDRRVLYDPMAKEVAEWCVESVQQIRGELTNELKAQERGQPLAGHLRAMRRACRRFLTWFGPADDASSLVIPRAYLGSLMDWRLQQALGELRAVFGLHIALLAVEYRIDLEGDLEPLAETVDAALPPAEPDED